MKRKTIAQSARTTQTFKRAAARQKETPPLAMHHEHSADLSVTTDAENLTGPDKPRVLKQIECDVERLIVPDLSGLQALRLQVEAAIRSKRAAMAREQAGIRQDGFAAATRLSMSDKPKARLVQHGYFETVQQRLPATAKHPQRSVQ